MRNGFVVLDNMRNGKEYDGTTLKFGVTLSGEDYIIKHKKDNSVSTVYSEHIASRFMRGLNVNCQETWLGWYNGEIVVILKDFTKSGFKLRSFKDTRQSSLDTEQQGKEYTYNDVLDMLNKHKKLGELGRTKMLNQFWQMFICDAILANRDRHPGNWGVLTNEEVSIPAPLYDNGGCLFPDVCRVIDEFEKDEYHFLYQRAERYPASLLKMIRPGEIQSRRTNYYEMFGKLNKNEIQEAQVKQLTQTVGLKGVFQAIIATIQPISDIIPANYRRFYIMIICIRYLHIIERKPVDCAYKIVREMMI